MPPLLLFATALFVQDVPYARELRVPVPAGHVIAAVVESPGPASPLPAVIFVAGAGEHDRDGYTHRASRGHNDAFRVLAAAVAEVGMVAVRYDKVGTGRSTGDYRRSATTLTLADDLAALVRAVRHLPEVDSSRVFLVGYSEGGAVAARVAAADPAIAGVTLLAAPAWSGRRILDYQVRLAAARERRTLSYTSADLIEAHLVVKLREREGTEAWFPFFLDYDPLPPMRALRMPVLVVQGDRDEAVLFEQAYEIVEAIRAGGNGQVRLALLPGLGHALAAPETRVPRGEPLPLSAQVVTLVTGWLADAVRDAAVP